MFFISLIRNSVQFIMILCVFCCEMCVCQVIWLYICAISPKIKLHPKKRTIPSPQNAGSSSVIICLYGLFHRFWCKKLQFKHLQCRKTAILSFLIVFRQKNYFVNFQWSFIARVKCISFTKLHFLKILYYCRKIK